MKKLLKIMLAAMMIIGLASCSNESQTEEKESADTIIIGKIYTGDENGDFVEALAVKDGVIVYAGDEEGVSAYEAAETVTLEDGQLVMAGLGDAHTHAAVCWDAKLNAAQIPNGATKEECLQIIADYVAKYPDKEYYKANGWIGSVFENQCPTADLLDAISDKPIVATSSDGHSV